MDEAAIETADESLTEQLRRELAFYFSAYHGMLEHRRDAASCMENDCVRIKNLLYAPAPDTRQRAERAARKLAHELNGGDRPDCSYPPELAALIDSPSIDNEAALAKWATDFIAAEFDNNQ